MKVVRRDKCEFKPTVMKVSDISSDVVFSGRPRPFNDGLWDSGTFVKCEGGFIRLAYGNGGCNVHTFFKEFGTIEDYKELNAYLCIEE